MVTRATRQLDLTFLALADPTRRAILERLAQGEARVTDVAQPFAMSLNAVSKHIRILERAGLVCRRRIGREHMLSLDLAPLARPADWIATQRAFWTTRLAALDRLLEQRNPGSGTARHPVNRSLQKSERSP